MYLRSISALAISLGLAVMGASAASAQSSPDAAWSGFYAGGGLGIASFDDLLEEEAAIVAGVPVSGGEPRDIAATLLAGYRHGIGSFVLGAEASALVGSGRFDDRTCRTLADAPCANAGIVGTIGPILRLSAIVGVAVSDRTLLLIGAGPSRTSAEVEFLHTAAFDGFDGYSFEQDIFPGTLSLDGRHLTIAIEHAAERGPSLRVGLTLDRFDVAQEMTYQTAVDLGSTRATSYTVEGLRLEAVSVAASLIWRF